MKADGNMDGNTFVVLMPHFMVCGIMGRGRVGELTWGGCFCTFHGQESRGSTGVIVGGGNTDLKIQSF